MNQTPTPTDPNDSPPYEGSVSYVLDNLCIEWEAVIEEIREILSSDYTERTQELINLMREATTIDSTIRLAQRFISKPQ